MGAIVSKKAKIMAAIGSLLLVITNKFPMFDILLVLGWDPIWVNYVYDVWLVFTVVIGTVVVVYFGTMEGEDVQKYKDEVKKQNKMIAELRAHNQTKPEDNNQPIITEETTTPIDTSATSATTTDIQSVPTRK
jgi:hypothetical protein